jgi:hypothetical protein
VGRGRGQDTAATAALGGPPGAGQFDTRARFGEELLPAGREAALV